MEEIKVSVICVTYNHEPYIRDALEGFVMQQTDFAYEVLIHDDASTDKTAEIIREYERKYPDLIKPVYQTKNQYSQGVNISTVFLFPKVKGKYIALCEGDDYWTSPHKLQKQYEALEQHPEVDMCAHSSWILSNDGKMEESAASPVDTVLAAEQMIARDGGYVNTNTVMYRAALNHEIPPFRRIMEYDYTLKVHGALRGGIYYLHDFMSVYRKFVPDSWTDKMRSHEKERTAFDLKVMNILDCLNRDTHGQYEKAIAQARYYYKWDLAYLQKDISWICREEQFKQQRKRTQIGIYLACRFPEFYKRFIVIYKKYRKSRGIKNV